MLVTIDMKPHQVVERALSACQGNYERLEALMVAFAGSGYEDYTKALMPLWQKAIANKTKTDPLQR